MTELSGAVELVNTKFADASAYASEAYAAAGTMLSALAASAAVIPLPSADVSISVSSPTVALPVFIAPPLGGSSMPELELDEVDLVTVEKFGSDDLPFITPDISASIIEPTEVNLESVPGISIPASPTFKGSLVVADFDATEAVTKAMYILTQLQNNIETVGAVILEFIIDPQQAIGDDLVTEMTNAAFQRIDDDFAAKDVEVRTFFSSRGWNFPQGPLIGRETELARAHSRQRAEIQRDVLIKNFELSNQNFIASLQMYIQYVQVNNAAAVNTLNVLLSALKYAFEAVIARLQAYIALYQTESDVFKTEISAQVQVAMAIIEKNKAAVSVYTAEVQAMGAKIGAIASYNNNLTQQLQAEVTAYGAKVQGATAINATTMQKYSADIQKYTAEVQGAVADAEVRIKESANSVAVFDANARAAVSAAQVQVQAAGLEVEAGKASAQLAMAQVEASVRNAISMSSISAEIAKASAQVAAQLAAAAFSSVSAGAQVSYHTNANYDETKEIVETRINLSGAV